MTDITMNCGGVFPNSAAANVPSGLIAAVVTAGGSGGSSGTGKAATWAGGNFLVNPTVTYDVVGGVMVNVDFKPGLYIGASAAMSLPTPTYPGTAGVVAVALTYDFLYPQGTSGGGSNGYWVVSADGRQLDRYYRNASNVATRDSAIPAAPLVPGIAASLATAGVVLPSLPTETALFAEFSASKYYNVGLTYTTFADWVSGLSGTFSRGGSNHTYVNASGLLANGSANTPRFTYDPVTLKPLGLLYEPASSNLFAYSQQLAVPGSSWQFASVETTATDNVAVGPDGTMSAGFVKETTGNNIHRIIYWFSGASLAASSNYAFQVFLKANGRSKILVAATSGAGFGSVTVDLAARTVSDDSWRIEQWQNGWFRLWKTATATQNVICSMQYNLLDNGGAVAYPGDGVSGVYIGGHMLEAVPAVGNPPTTYINRTGADAATRSADVLTLTIPVGVSKLTYSFGDLTTQLVTVAPGVYTVPNNLTGRKIKSLITVDLASTGSPVTSVAGRIGNVTLSQADINGLKATDSVSFTGLTVGAATMNLGGAVFKNVGACFQWTVNGPSGSDGYRAQIIGWGCAKSVVNFSNSAVIGTDAAGVAATIATAVVIGDTAAGNSPFVSNSNVIGNEAGNGSSIITSNIIGNLAKIGGLGKSATSADVMGFSGLLFNGATNTVGIGARVGRGVQGSIGQINNSVLIGSDTGSSIAGATVTNLILIGYNVQPPTPTTSNYLSLGDVFVGDISTGRFKIQKQDASDATLTVAKLNLSNLPTSNPAVAGAVWRSGSDLKISLG